MGPATTTARNGQPTVASHPYCRTTDARGGHAGVFDVPFLDLLSAHSGWTTATEIHWNVPRAGLLGVSSGSWSTAPRISAHA